MADLNDVAVFVKVAQLESFTRAARALAMPVSTVSRKVTSLEDQLGVTLLQRTTRKLSLTTQGRSYYAQCSEPLGQLAEAETALDAGTEGARGPAEDFCSRHPRSGGVLRVPVAVHEKVPERSGVDLFITNQFVDLVADNVDVAIRFGELPDSTIIAKRIGRSVRYLVASPDYLKGRSVPAKPEDLTKHQCVLLNGRNNEAEWHLVNGRKSGEAACRGVYIEPRLPERQRLHLQGTRYWSFAVELLRAGNQERRSCSHLARVVIAGDLTRT